MSQWRFGRRSRCRHRWNLRRWPRDASALAQYGARVFVTGRSANDSVGNEEQITGIRCDHRVDTEVTAAFERVAREAGKIEILVNNVWGGYERMVEDGTGTRRISSWPGD